MRDFLKRLLNSRTVPRELASVGLDEEDDEPEDGEAEQAQRRYLEYIGGTSAKFYAVVLSRTEEGWTVAFNFGRIGYPRAWAHKVEDVSLDEASRVFEELLREKTRGGYEDRPWPATLSVPDGSDGRDASLTDSSAAGIFVATTRGSLPPASGGRVGGVALPAGRLVVPDEMQGSAGPGPVSWISDAPLPDVAGVWSRLAAAFGQTGLWPLVIVADDAEWMAEIFLETTLDPRGDAGAVLSRWWTENTGDDDEFDRATYAPFGRRFPGLAPRTAGERPTSIDTLVAGASGHLGLVGAHRPADVLAATFWTGAANYDADAADQSTVLRSWEDRFDAYIVGLGFDTVTLAVARPPRDAAAARGVAAEHMAFCPDNIWQGVGTISEYAESIIGEPLWTFWWD